MNMYAISFITRPSERWINYAGHSTPKVIVRLLEGSNEEYIDDAQLDAIIEWDKTVCAKTLTASMLEYWPLSIDRN